MRYLCLHFKIWHVFTGFCTVLCALVLLLLLFYRHPTQQRPIQNTSNLYLIFKKQETKSADNVNIDTSAISYLPIFNYFFYHFRCSRQEVKAHFRYTPHPKVIRSGTKTAKKTSTTHSTYSLLIRHSSSMSHCVLNRVEVKELKVL